MNGLSTEVRLILQSKVNSKTGCVEWKGQHKSTVKETNEYSSVEHDGKSTTAHRAAWLVFVGEIPDGMFVLHKCDNRRCFSPDHLYLGTKKQNRQDFMLRHPKAKELMATVQKQGTKALKSFWANMTAEERKEFCARRAATQRAKNGNTHPCWGTPLKDYS